MTKHTIGIYKAYKNSGKFRLHSNKTKKSWKHYFIDDDYESDESEYFQTEWVSSFKAVILKRKQLYKRRFYCTECGRTWQAYVTKNQHELEECPYCDD